MDSALSGSTPESSMAADSDSKIAWHRAQLRKHRDALQGISTSKSTVGEIADPKTIAQTRKLIAGLKQKIATSEQVITQHERQTRRPLATDLRSLSNVHWSSWNAYGEGQR
jgi:hypothetical protein